MADEIEKMTKVAVSKFSKDELKYNQDSLAEAFPEVDPGFVPLGSRLIIETP